MWSTCGTRAGVAQVSSRELVSRGDDDDSGDFVYIHAAVEAYVFVGSASVATGGKPFPLGRPVIT